MSSPRLPAKITGYRADEINEIIDYMRAITPMDSVSIAHDFSPHGTRPKVLRMAASGAALDYSVFCFGFSISGAIVTITAGEIHWGARAAYTTVATPVTIGENLQYTGLEFDGTTITILPPNVDKTVFQSDDTKYRIWLHQFSYTTGSASLYRIGHLGNIELDASFG